MVRESSCVSRLGTFLPIAFSVGVTSIHGSWDVFFGILDSGFRAVQLGFPLRAESVGQSKVWICYGVSCLPCVVRMECRNEM